MMWPQSDCILQTSFPSKLKRSKLDTRQPMIRPTSILKSEPSDILPHSFLYEKIHSKILNILNSYKKYTEIKIYYQNLLFKS